MNAGFRLNHPHRIDLVPTLHFGRVEIDANTIGLNRLVEADLGDALAAGYGKKSAAPDLATRQYSSVAGNSPLRE